MNYLEKLCECFYQAFMNGIGEIILHKKANDYFNLKNCETELDVKCKVLEFCSRSYKQEPYDVGWRNADYQHYMRNGINEYLGTNFTADDLETIYTYLGNACNHEKTVEFVNSGYDMQILKK